MLLKFFLSPECLTLFIIYELTLVLMALNNITLWWSSVIFCIIVMAMQVIEVVVARKQEYKLT